MREPPTKRQRKLAEHVERETPKVPTPVPKNEPDQRYSQTFRRGFCTNCGLGFKELVLVDTPAIECGRCGWLVQLEPIEPREHAKTTEKTSAVRSSELGEVIVRPTIKIP